MFRAAIIALTLAASSYGQDIGINEPQFQKAITSNGYPSPTSAQYNAYITSLSKGSISTKLEAAMYLAQLIHESGGLQKKRETGCSGQNGGSTCKGRHYGDPSHKFNKPCGKLEGRSYYGRGYIQLTWCDNYLRASKQFGLGEALKNDPDSVASSEDTAWDTSAWYWKTRVHGPLGRTDEFGRTTRAIHGTECPVSNSAKIRFQKYQKVFAAYGLPGTPNENGCYN